MILTIRSTVHEEQVAGEYQDLRLLFSDIMAYCVDVRHIAIASLSICVNPRDFLVGRLISKTFETDERDGLLIVYLLQIKVLRTQRLIYNASRIPVYSTVDMSQAVSSPFAVILHVRDGTGHLAPSHYNQYIMEVTMRGDSSRYSVLILSILRSRGRPRETLGFSTPMFIKSSSTNIPRPLLHLQPFFQSPLILSNLHSPSTPQHNRLHLHSQCPARFPCCDSPLHR